MKDVNKIKYIVIDVDGTMTDGSIYYDEYGNETKKFCTKDAAGFFAAKYVGIKILVLTGRTCQAVQKRMSELKVDYIEQGIKDKQAFLKSFMEINQISKEELAYIGDDLNDFPSMALAGWIGCPQDSCEEIIDISDYVAEKKGGCGAVRDIICALLKLRGEWELAIQNVYGFGC